MNKKILIIIIIITGMIFLIIFFKSSLIKKELILSGNIESTIINVNSEVSGRIISLSKDEGDSVKKDEIIVIVDSTTQEMIVKELEQIAIIKKAKYDELKIGTRAEEIEQAEVTVESAKENYNFWNDKLIKTEQIYKSGNLPENQYLEVKNNTDMAKKNLEQAELKLKLLIKGATNQSILALKADYESSKIKLEQAKFILDKYNIKSNIDGIYISRNIEIGDIVNIGSNIAEISDLSNLWVNVYIPEKYLYLVEQNQLTDVKINSLNKHIKGKIIYISNKAEFTPKNIETNEAKENTVFKIKIKLIDDINLIKPGMTADVIILKTRSNK